MIQIESARAPFTSPPSLIAGDLSGAYNEIGTRQWFARKRIQLDGRSPLDWLKPRWKPSQPGPQERNGNVFAVFGTRPGFIG